MQPPIQLLPRHRNWPWTAEIPHHIPHKSPREATNTRETLWPHGRKSEELEFLHPQVKLGGSPPARRRRRRQGPRFRPLAAPEAQIPSTRPEEESRIALGVEGGEGEKKFPRTDLGPRDALVALSRMRVTSSTTATAANMAASSSSVICFGTCPTNSFTLSSPLPFPCSSPPPTPAAAAAAAAASSCCCCWFCWSLSPPPSSAIGVRVCGGGGGGGGGVGFWAWVGVGWGGDAAWRRRGGGEREEGKKAID